MSDLVRYEITDLAAPAAGADLGQARRQVDRILRDREFQGSHEPSWLDTLKTREDSMTRSAGTHALLKRMEDASKPLVAAIHGNALGGGLEVAQACHFRVATKDAKVGQPEVLLGIIPGAGGTQRLPRLAGAKIALEMCTEGKPVAAANAQAAGIIDHIVDGDLLAGAIAFAKSKAKAREIRKAREISLTDAQKNAGLEAVAAARAALKKTAKGMNAPHAVVNAIEAGLQRPFDEGSVRERELFAECVVSTESKALRHLFFAEREVAKVPPKTSNAPRSSAPARWAAASR